MHRVQTYRLCLSMENHKTAFGDAKEVSADCIFIDPDILGHAQGNGDTRELSKIVQSVALGASCSVEIVQPRIVRHEYLKPAA